MYERLNLFAFISKEWIFNRRKQTERDSFILPISRRRAVSCFPPSKILVSSSTSKEHWARSRLSSSTQSWRFLFSLMAPQPAEKTCLRQLWSSHNFPVTVFCFAHEKFVVCLVCKVSNYTAHCSSIKHLFYASSSSASRHFIPLVWFSSRGLWCIMCWKYPS